MNNIVIFGCGNIAHRIALSINNVDTLKLYGFASKNINKAKEYATQYNALKYGTYIDFLNDNQVNAIYIATYNLTHYELIKECLLHNKNVICEKPMLFDKESLKELFDLAKDRNLLLMEALKSVFNPAIIKVKDIIDSNTLGKPIHAYASFARKHEFPIDHWIYDTKTGGALKDLGTYTIGTLNYLFGEPLKYKTIKNNTSNISDNTSITSIIYKNGVKANSFVSNRITVESLLMITFENGYIKMSNFWKTNIFEIVSKDKKEIIEVPFIDDFHYELEHFSNLLSNHIFESNVMSYKASNDIVSITNS